MFTAIRIVFWGIAFFACFILIKKSRIIQKKKWSIIAFLTSVILAAISAFIPFENAFVTFSSPETSYKYTTLVNAKAVINGENNDFVIGQRNDTDTYLIVPKTKDEWKIGIGKDTKKVFHTISDGIEISVYQYKNSNDYYITVLDTNGGPAEINDTFNSNFARLDRANSALKTTFCIYYAHISDFNSDYTITVNGNVIKLHK